MLFARNTPKRSRIKPTPSIFSLIFNTKQLEKRDNEISMTTLLTNNQKQKKSNGIWEESNFYLVSQLCI